MTLGFPSDVAYQPKKKSSGSGCVGGSVFAIAISIVFIFAVIASGNGGGESPATSTAVSESEVSTAAADAAPDTAIEPYSKTPLATPAPVLSDND